MLLYGIPGLQTWGREEIKVAVLIRDSLQLSWVPNSADQL